MKDFPKHLDKWLYKLYKSNDNERINLEEFREDFKRIANIRTLLNRYLTTKHTHFLALRNQFLIIQNIFGIKIMEYISIKYFTHTSELFELFCTLVYYFADVRLSNRLNDDFIKWLGENDKYK